MGDKSSQRRGSHDLHLMRNTSKSGASMVTEQHDSVEITYVAAGNGLGEVETTVYKRNGKVVATLTYTYNADDKVSSITKS